MSYRTVEKAQKIEKLGSQKQIEDLINDKKSIHKITREIESEQEKKRLVQEAIKINSQLTLPTDRVLLYYGDILHPYQLLILHTKKKNIYHYMKIFLQLSTRN